MAANQPSEFEYLYFTIRTALLGFFLAMLPITCSWLMDDLAGYGLVRNPVMYEDILQAYGYRMIQMTMLASITVSIVELFVRDPLVATMSFLVAGTLVVAAVGFAPIIETAGMHKPECVNPQYTALGLYKCEYLKYPE